MMKKTFILLFIQVCCLALTGVAQHTGTSSVYLTNYMLKDQVVGYVKVRKGEIKSVRVSGPDASVFTVSKDHQLVLKPLRKLGPRLVYNVTLTVRTTAGREAASFKIVRGAFIRNKVIAHRGAWKNTGAAENSIAALKQAIALKCEGSEFDVHMSADSLPVINHDAAIQGISIAKTNSSELLGLKLSNGESLPTLEAYLKAGMEQSRTKLILEIKASELGRESSIALTRKVVALVEKLQAQAWVDYISFDYDVCKEVMTLAPYAKVAYLKGDKTPAELAADKFFGLDYHFSILQKNPTWVADAKNLNLTVNVWTVNDQPTLEDLLRQDVDFITTNEPELLLSLLKK